MENLTHTAHATLALGTTLSVLAGLAVALRLITKRLVKSAFAADDWWIIASVIMMWVAGSILAWGLLSNNGRGALRVDRQDPNFRYKEHTVYLKSMYVTSVLYYAVAAASKISILCLYRRIFSVHSFKRMSLLFGLLVVLWWLAATIANIFSCMPIELLWDLSLDGRCFNFNIFWLSMGVVETIIDILILFLPIKMVMGLQLSRRNKIVLSGVFLLGGFVIVTGVLRVAYAYKPGSMNVAFTGAELWASVHLGTGIICACLPTYRPLLSKLGTKATSFRQRYHYKSWHLRRAIADRSTQVARSETGDSVEPHINYLGDSMHDGANKAHFTVCQSTKSQDSTRYDDTPKPIHLDRITVRSTVEWS